MKSSRSKGKSRVFLVDDHAILLDGLRELINRTEDLEVCGQAMSGEEAIQKLPDSKPNLAVVDLSLPGIGGLELLKTLHDRVPSVSCLVLSMHDETIYAERCLRAGARGYLMKHHSVDSLVAALRQIQSGKIFLSPQMSDRLLESITRGRPGGGSSVDDLSDRELEVYELIGRGQGASVIARKLHLSVKTVESYRAKLKEKLNLRDADELFQHALRWAEKRSS